MGDIDMNMFDLQVEGEERKAERSDEKTRENALASQKVDDFENNRDTMDEALTGDAMMQNEHLCHKKIDILKAKEEKEQEEREDINLKRERADEKRATEQEQNRAFEEEEKVKSSKESKANQWRWEMIADSDEEDPEFDRIISSMLMMTLEDIQVESTKNKGELKNHKSGEEGAFRELGLDAQSADDPEEFDKVLNEKLGSVMKEYTSREVKELSHKHKSGDTRAENENMQEGGQISSVRKSPAEETDELKPSCPETEADDEEKPCGKGNATEQREEEEAEEDTASCEKSDVDEKPDETEGQKTDDMEQSSSSPPQEGFLSPDEIQKRYSAVSLRSITTEVLKVLNATEELLQEVEGGDDSRPNTTCLPPNTDPAKLDQQFCRLEEKVYVAAGSVYSLEAELSDLDECARGICSSTTHMQLSFLEEQVAAAAARVQQSELQISDISTRIAALKSAGLNVDPQSRFTKARTTTEASVTLDSSRQMRRRLPAPPIKEDQET